MNKLTLDEATRTRAQIRAIFAKVNHQSSLANRITHAVQNTPNGATGIIRSRNFAQAVKFHKAASRTARKARKAAKVFPEGSSLSKKLIQKADFHKRAYSRLLKEIPSSSPVDFGV